MNIYKEAFFVKVPPAHSHPGAKRFLYWIRNLLKSDRHADYPSYNLFLEKTINFNPVYLSFAKPPSWYASFELLHIVSLTFPRKNLYFADMKARSKDQRCVALGLTIKKLREQKKLTQEQLAEKADIHTSYIGQIERGMRYPSLKILFKIADALNAKIIDLFKEV